MSTYGRIFEYIKVKAFEVMLAEIIPVEITVQLNGKSFKTSNWIDLIIWQEVKMLIEGIIDEEYIESNLNKKFKLKKGKSVFIGYKFQEHNSSSGIYLNPLDHNDVHDAKLHVEGTDEQHNEPNELKCLLGLASSQQMANENLSDLSSVQNSARKIEKISLSRTSVLPNITTRLLSKRESIESYPPTLGNQLTHISKDGRFVFYKECQVSMVVTIYPTKLNCRGSKLPTYHLKKNTLCIKQMLMEFLNQNDAICSLNKKARLLTSDLNKSEDLFAEDDSENLHSEVKEINYESAIEPFSRYENGLNGSLFYLNEDESNHNSSFNDIVNNCKIKEESYNSNYGNDSVVDENKSPVISSGVMKNFSHTQRFKIRKRGKIRKRSNTDSDMKQEKITRFFNNSQDSNDFISPKSNLHSKSDKKAKSVIKSSFREEEEGNSTQDDEIDCKRIYKEIVNSSFGLEESLNPPSKKKRVRENGRRTSRSSTSVERSNSLSHFSDERKSCEDKVLINDRGTSILEQPELDICSSVSNYMIDSRTDNQKLKDKATRSLSCSSVWSNDSELPDLMSDSLFDNRNLKKNIITRRISELDYSNNSQLPNIMEDDITDDLPVTDDTSDSLFDNRNLKKNIITRTISEPDYSNNSQLPNLMEDDIPDDLPVFTADTSDSLFDVSSSFVASVHSVDSSNNTSEFMITDKFSDSLPDLTDISSHNSYSFSNTQDDLPDLMSSQYISRKVSEPSAIPDDKQLPLLERNEKITKTKDKTVKDSKKLSTKEKYKNYTRREKHSKLRKSKCKRVKHSSSLSLITTSSEENEMKKLKVEDRVDEANEQSKAAELLQSSLTLCLESFNSDENENLSTSTDEYEELFIKEIYDCLRSLTFDDFKNHFEKHLPYFKQMILGNTSNQRDKKIRRGENYPRNIESESFVCILDERLCDDLGHLFTSKLGDLIESTNSSISVILYNFLVILPELVKRVFLSLPLTKERGITTDDECEEIFYQLSLYDGRVNPL